MPPKRRIPFSNWRVRKQRRENYERMVANETREERQERLLKMSIQAARRRANETEDQRRERLKEQAYRTNRRRKNKTKDRRGFTRMLLEVQKRCQYEQCKRCQIQSEERAKRLMNDTEFCIPAAEYSANTAVKLTLLPENSEELELKIQMKFQEGVSYSIGQKLVENTSALGEPALNADQYILPFIKSEPEESELDAYSQNDEHIMPFIKPEPEESETYNSCQASGADNLDRVNVKSELCAYSRNDEHIMPFIKSEPKESET